MKKLKIKSQNGSSLIEALVSFLIFEILIVSISTTLFVALKINTDYILAGQELQTEINVIRSEAEKGAEKEIGFTYNEEEYTQKIYLSDTKEIVGFRPKE